MLLDPFDAAQKFIGGFIHEEHMQAWIKLIFSLIATCFVSFFGTFGLTLLSQVKLGISPSIALIYSLAEASLTMALAFLGVWLKNPATKGISILYFGNIKTAQIEELTKEGQIFDPNLQKK